MNTAEMKRASGSPQPASLQALQEQVRAAHAAAQPLRIRGGGSKDFYASGQARQTPQVLDMRPHSGILSYQPSELFVTVRAGTPLAELEAALADQGQCLPFEPPHFSDGRLELPPKPPHFTAGGLESESKPPHSSGGAATCGGMVAAGLSGPARASVGGVRDYVLGLSMLSGRGEALTFGGQVMKNVAGYDVSRLMVGALGTLGVLTEISLKVLPKAPAEATLAFEMTQAQALAQLNTWGGQPLPLNASCWRQEAGVGKLSLRLRGAAAAVQAACKGLGGQVVDADLAGPYWQQLRDLNLPWFAALDPLELWRLSLPQSAPVLDLPTAEFGTPLVEWHGALRWYLLAPGRGQALRAAANAAGGTASLFIAAGVQSADAIPRFDAISPTLLRVMRQLKREFDPAGIFNPGRLHAEL